LSPGGEVATGQGPLGSSAQAFYVNQTIKAKKAAFMTVIAMGVDAAPEVTELDAQAGTVAMRSGERVVCARLDAERFKIE
jgi:hypothetical protein